MTSITREGLELIAENLGLAREVLVKRIGDTSTHPAALLDIEAAFCILRGSTLFYDTDYGADWVLFNEVDPIGLGLQGASVTADDTATSLPFPVLTSGIHWSPQYFGPPCTEGFGIWYYNAWKGWDVPQQIDNIESSGNYATRVTYNYPIRYDTGSSSYIRVPFFDHAQWISFHNATAGTLGHEDAIVEISLSVDDIEGIQQTDHLTDMPLDLRVMYYQPLVQNYSSGWQNIGVDGVQDILSPLAFRLIAGTNGAWTLQINVPSDLNSPNGWTADAWWHVVLFWGSLDTAAQYVIPTFHPLKVDNVTPIPVFALSVGNQIRWPKKHFFRKDVQTKIELRPNFINNPNPYIIANSYQNFIFIDGSYSVPNVPVKYPLPTQLTSTFVDANSLLSVVETLPIGCYCALIVAVLTSGDADIGAGAQSQPFIIAGPIIGPEFAMSDWSKSPYFPPVPDNYVPVAKIVVKRAPKDVFGIVEGETNNSPHADFDPFNAAPQFITEDIVITWMEQLIPSFAIPPLGDPVLAAYLLNPLYNFLLKYRALDIQDPIIAVAYILLTLASRTPSSIVPNRITLSDPNGQASYIFRTLLKKPLDPELQPTNENDPLAIPFTAEARGVVEELAGLPPSTEMMHFDADYLYLTNQTLNIPNTLEIFQETVGQCTAIDLNSPGNRVGLDYTLRLVLEYPDHNVLLKDWYIMASRYLLTAQEYAQRIRAGQATIGYFTFDQLSTINEWRLYGYSGLVPDLTMGNSQILQTRVVSPLDNTQITEQQFIDNLLSQGYSQQQIDDAISEYLDNGGTFYVIDLNHYDNHFVGIKSAAISTAVFTYDTISYWQSNVENYFGLPSSIGLTPVLPVYSSLYADAFTIAQDGLSAHSLESYGTQALTLEEQTFVINGFTLGLALDLDAYAFKITPSAGGITEIGLQLKTTLFNIADTLLSNDGTIQVFLYSDSGTGPGSLLITGGTLDYKSIQKDNFLEYRLPLIADLNGGVNYWIVVTLSSIPVGGDIIIAVENMVTDFMDNQWNTTAVAFTPINNIGTFSCTIPVKFIADANNITGALTNSGQVTAVLYSDSNGRPGTKIVSGSSINFSDLTTVSQNFVFSATTPLLQNTLYWIVFETSTRPRGGSIQIDLAGLIVNQIQFNVNFSGVIQFWEDTVYLPWLTLYSKSPDVLGAFNRTTGNITQTLPPPNLSRQVGGFYQLEGTWAFTCQPLDEPSIITIYPRAINDSGTWRWVPSLHKIYVCARLLVGNIVKDYFITLDPANTPGPVQINSGSELATALVFLYVAKTSAELLNGTHGAPAGDRLVLRSS